MKFLDGLTRSVCRCVLVSWLLATLGAIPHFVVSVQTEERLVASPNDIIVYQCHHGAAYTAAWQRKLFVTFVSFYLFVSPACVMTYCYANIVRVVGLRAGT